MMMMMMMVCVCVCVNEKTVCIVTTFCFPTFVPCNTFFSSAIYIRTTANSTHNHKATMLQTACHSHACTSLGASFHKPRYVFVRHRTCTATATTAQRTVHVTTQRARRTDDTTMLRCASCTSRGEAKHSCPQGTSCQPRMFKRECWGCCKCQVGTPFSLHTYAQGVTQPPYQPSVPPATFGFVDNAERLNSRAAMVCSLGRILIDALSTTTSQWTSSTHTDWLFRIARCGGHCQQGLVGDAGLYCGSGLGL